MSSPGKALRVWLLLIVLGLSILGFASYGYYFWLTEKAFFSFDGSMALSQSQRFALGKSYLKALRWKRPNLLLITIDTLRYDHLSYTGFKNAFTPSMDSLARQGIFFTDAISQVPVTLPSHASIMTGTYPPYHGARDNGQYFLPPSQVTLAEMLKDQGYKTAAFVSAFVLDKRFGLNQGFDFYDDDFSQSLLSHPSARKNWDIAMSQLPRAGHIDSSSPFSSSEAWNVDKSITNEEFLDYERRASEVIPLAMDWLKKNSSHKFFLWIHLFDPHAPYYPNNDFFPNKADVVQKNLCYAREVVFTDHWVGMLLGAMKEWNLLDNTIVALIADHGESLGEHNYAGHGELLYHNTLKVPFILYLPKMEPHKRVMSELVRSIDLMPTILELLSLPVPDHIQGKSLLPLIFGMEKDLGLDSYSETVFPLRFVEHPKELRAISTPTLKYILTLHDGKVEKTELYNLKEDPLELRNLLLQAGDGAIREKERFFKKRLVEIVKEKGTEPEEAQRPMDEETKEKLRSLGYLR